MYEAFGEEDAFLLGASKSKKKKIAAGFATGGMSLLFSKKTAKGVKKGKKGTAAMIATGGLAAPFVGLAAIAKKRKAKKAAKKAAGQAEKPAPVTVTTPATPAPGAPTTPPPATDQDEGATPPQTTASKLKKYAPLAAIGLGALALPFLFGE
jgi:hypothetical protein